MSKYPALLLLLPYLQVCQAAVTGQVLSWDMTASTGGDMWIAMKGLSATGTVYTLGAPDQVYLADPTAGTITLTAYVAKSTGITTHASTCASGVCTFATTHGSTHALFHFGGVKSGTGTASTGTSGAWDGDLTINEGTSGAQGMTFQGADTNQWYLDANTCTVNAMAADTATTGKYRMEGEVTCGADFTADANIHYLNLYFLALPNLVVPTSALTVTVGAAANPTGTATGTVTAGGAADEAYFHKVAISLGSAGTTLVAAKHYVVLEYDTTVTAGATAALATTTIFSGDMGTNKGTGPAVAANVDHYGGYSLIPKTITITPPSTGSSSRFAAIFSSGILTAMFAALQ